MIRNAEQYRNALARAKDLSARRQSDLGHLMSAAEQNELLALGEDLDRYELSRMGRMGRMGR